MRPIRFGIRSKVALTFSGLIVVLIAIFGALSIYRFRAASSSELRKTAGILRANLVDKGRALVRNVALSAENALAENNFEFLTAIIDTTAAGDPDISFAAIVDPAGRVLVHSDPRQRGQSWQSEHDRRILQIQEPIDLERPVQPGEEPIIDVAAPIGKGDDRLGTLRFGLNLRELRADIARAAVRQRAELRRVLWIYAGLAFACVLVGVLGALLLATGITKPLSRLTRHAQTIAEGKLDEKVPTLGRDEVGVLASNLDTMRLAIQRELEDVRALHVVGKQLSGTLIRREVLRAALEAMRQRVGAARAAMYLADGDPRDGMWRLSASDGFGAGDDQAPPREILMAEGLQTGEIVVLDRQNGRLASLLPAALRPGGGNGATTLIAPLTLGAVQLGLLILLDDRTRYDARELQFVDTVTSSMAQSLENIRLLEATAEQARIDSELRTAQAVQRALIPDAPPACAGLEVAGAYVPATEVGGDWYGFLSHQELQQLHILVGDVTGHGVPAALLSASACATCRLIGEQHQAPGMPALGAAALLDHLNRVVCDLGRGELWMTFFAARIDVGAGEVVFASAGHNAPYHLPAAGNGKRKIGFLKTGPTLPLGSQAVSDRFREFRTAIAPGDLLVFFTDGLIENTNPAGKEWGYHALDEVLARAGDAGADALRDTIMKSAYAHYQEQRRQDDITLVVVKVTGA